MKGKYFLIMIWELEFFSNISFLFLLSITIINLF